MKGKKTILVIIMIHIFLGLSFIQPLTSNNCIQNDRIDQQQIFDETRYTCLQYYYAQSFIPRLNTLTRLFLRINLETDDLDYPDFIISIREEINGIDLTSFQLDSSKVARGLDWYEFDVSDITVTPGEIYFIVVHEQLNDAVSTGLYGSSSKMSGNAYANGEAWYGNDEVWTKQVDYDYCFKTYGYYEGEQIDISIDSITGGLGISSIIVNIGEQTVFSLNWKITVKPSILGFILSDNETNGILGDIDGNESKQIQFKGLQGIGPIIITVEADEIVKKASGFLLGPLVLRVSDLSD